MKPSWSIEESLALTVSPGLSRFLRPTSCQAPSCCWRPRRWPWPGPTRRGPGSTITGWKRNSPSPIGPFGLNKSVSHWIADGLMGIFFFVVGLEIKRELLAGELADPRKAALPVLAAVGGMVVPALVYYRLQRQRGVRPRLGYPDGHGYRLRAGHSRGISRAAFPQDFPHRAGHRGRHRGHYRGRNFLHGRHRGGKPAHRRPACWGCPSPPTPSACATRSSTSSSDAPSGWRFTNRAYTRPSPGS